VAYLTLVLQGREVRKFLLNPTVTTIGRSQDNDIVINNLALSRRHAEVVARPGGAFEIKDLSSQNGVYINDERVRSGHGLSNRDTITLGNYHFVFFSEEPQVQGSADPEKDGPSEDANKPALDSERRLSIPLLVVKYNDVELQRFALKKTLCVIGRAKECDIQISERRLSRRHCEIIQEDGFRFRLRDLGSQNGTYVNRERVQDEARLTHGDVLNFADYTILFLADEEDYDGPDSNQGPAPSLQVGPSLTTQARSEIYQANTEFPEAYRPPRSREDRFVKPSDIGSDPDMHIAALPITVLPVPVVAPSSPRPSSSVVVQTNRPAIMHRQARAGGTDHGHTGATTAAVPSQGPMFVEAPKISRERRAVGTLVVDTARPAKPPQPTARMHKAQKPMLPPEDPLSEAALSMELPSSSSFAPRREPAVAVRSGGAHNVGAQNRPSSLPRSESEPPEHDDLADRVPTVIGAEHAEELLTPPPATAQRKPSIRTIKPALPLSEEHEDISDDTPVPGIEPELEEWFESRHEKSDVFYDEPSVLLDRGSSSVSQVLNHMMLDKEELETNLLSFPKPRRFSIRVASGDDSLFVGPLDKPVTILGNSDEADIPLRGRFVARRHSLLIQVRDSLLLVRLGSSSAARVNGLPRLQAFLKNNDVVQIDETTIEITEE
jgi:pSer/pThr/pTyr-binding forkhead associated (FHA) protein